MCVLFVRILSFSFCREFFVTICGGRWFVLFMGGIFVFTLVCEFDINLCEKMAGITLW